MTLKSLSRKYRVVLIFAYTPFLVSIIFVSQIYWLESIIHYKVLLILLLLIVPVLCTYILVLKNHSEELETEISNLSNLSNDNAQDIPKEKKILRPSEIHHTLTGLSEKEKECLRKFIKEDSRTLKFRFDDSAVDGLVSIGILDMVSKVAMFHHFSYSIVPIYWDYIKKKPKVIGL